MPIDIGGKVVGAKQTFDIRGLFEQVLTELRGTWRFRWHGLVLAWCLFALGALVTFVLPNKYQASSEVYADTEALMNPLLRGITVQPNVNQRLQVLTHTLLSRPNLKTIAQKSGLAVRATTPQQSENLLSTLASGIQINSAGARDLYTIAYRDKSRQTAKKVVQSILQVLMNNTLGANAQSTHTARQFLQQQVKDYSNKLNTAEAKMAKFEKANVGYIPNHGGGDYIARLQQAEQNLQSLENQKSTEIAQRKAMEKQMKGMATNSDSSAINPQVQSIDNEITADQQKRDALLLQYTSKYPNVVSLNRMIKELKTRRRKLEERAKSGSAMEVDSSNPVYQDMQKSLYSTQVKIQSLDSQISLQKKQIANLKSKVDRLTDVQMTLQKLTRNYDTTKKRYNQLLSRLDTAEISQSASMMGNNLKFRVISPPTAPVSPVSPKRRVLLVLVFLMSLAFGGGFAFVMHKIKPVFSSLWNLREMGDYPVLGSLSLLVSHKQRIRRRREIAGFVLGICLLVFFTGVGLALSGSLTHLVQHVFEVSKT